ncbi:LPD23 domain-containing protein [Marinobacter sp.]|uniref:LPD23 domain-containing protein n=1 Tax=Marinobacter sp. TaxID=50741 RepID=UPI003A8CEB4D
MNLPLIAVKTQNSVAYTGLESVIESDVLAKLRRDHAERIPASWVEHCADVLGLSPTSNALLPATDLWLVHRLSDQQLISDVLPAFGQVSELGSVDQQAQIQQWRNLYVPLQQHYRNKGSKPRVQARGTSPSTLRTILAKHFGEPAIAALLRQHRLHLVNTANELPHLRKHQSSQANQGIAGATYPDGSVYLVADNISAETAVGIFLHEVGEHAGMATMLGQDYGRLVQHFQRLLAAGDTYAQYAAMRVPLSTPDADVPSEQLAYLIEKVANDAVAMQGGEKGYKLGEDCLSRLRAWIFKTDTARWLESIGMVDGFTLRPADIAALARQSVDGLSGVRASIETDWLDLLDGDTLEELFSQLPEQRVTTLTEFAPEVMAGYLYALNELQAPGIGQTLDAHLPSLARMATGEFGDHLCAIAGSLITSSATHDTSEHLQSQLEAGGVIMLTAPDDTLSVVMATPDNDAATVLIYGKPGTCTEYQGVPIHDVAAILPRSSVPAPSGQYASLLAGKKNTVASKPAQVDDVLFQVGDSLAMPASTILSAGKQDAGLRITDHAIAAHPHNLVIDTPNASTISLGRVIQAIGPARATELLQCEEAVVYNTPSWNHVSSLAGASSLTDLLDQAPDLIGQLELPASTVFGQPHYRRWFADAGFDGAVFNFNGQGTAVAMMDSSQIVGLSDAIDNERMAGQDVDHARIVLAALNDHVEHTRRYEEAYEQALNGQLDDAHAEVWSAKFDVEFELEQALSLAPVAGIEGLTDDGRPVLLTPSSKEKGHWQLTRLGFDQQPVSDTLTPTKDQGIKYLLQEVTADSLRIHGLTPEPLKPGAQPKFTLAGEGARIALLNDLQAARNMLRAGERPEVVLRETGWYEGYDGRMRFEISDHSAALHYSEATAHQQAAGGAKRVGDYLIHRRLFTAYPSLADIPVEVNHRGVTSLVSYSDGRLLMNLRDDLSGSDLLSALLHELQHGIQLLEGFAIGGTEADFQKRDITEQQTQKIDTRIQALFETNPSFAAKQREANRRYSALLQRFPSEYEGQISVNWDAVNAESFHAYMALIDELQTFPEYDQYSNLDDERRRLERDRVYLYPWQQYQLLAGELEARTVECRMLLTESERRLVPPHANGDVDNTNELIFVFEPSFPTRHAAIAARATQDANTHDKPRYSLTEPERTWFYSALDKAVDRVHTIAGKSGEVFPAQALAWLKSQQKQGAFKKEELQWSGLEEWLAGQSGKIHTSAIKAFVAANGVQLQEIGLGHNTTESYNLPAKYPTQILPSSLGYRELLLCLPQEWASPPIPERPTELPQGFTIESLVSKGEELFFVAKNDGLQSGAFHNLHPTPEEAKRAALDKLHDAAIAAHATNNWDNFTSSHWPTHRNIVAHLRCTDRIDSDGRAHLFVEEIQSDWAQIGRSRGFKEEFVPGIMPEFTATQATAAEYAEQQGISIYRVLRKMNMALFGSTESDPANENNPTPDSIVNVVQANGEHYLLVPRGTTEEALSEAETHWIRQEEARFKNHRAEMLNAPIHAPFVSDTKVWTSLMIRRAFMYAADHGYEHVSFISGDQSAKRANQQKQIDQLTVERGHSDFFLLTAFDQAGKFTLDQQGATSLNLHEFVGRELADKIIALQPGEYQFSELGLMTGGDGMIDYYDNIVAQCVKEVLRKSQGPEVSSALVMTDHDQYTKQLSVTMTRDFTARIKQFGLPLFSLTEDAAVKEAAEAGLLGMHDKAVVYAAEPATSDDHVELFKSGMGARHFTTFDQAWRTACAARAQGETYKVTPAVISLTNPLPLTPESGGVLTRTQLTSLFSNQVVESLLQPGEDSVDVATLLAMPEAVEVLKARGYDGATFHEVREGVVAVRHVAFKPSVVTEGKAMLVSDPASGGQARLSISASAAAQPLDQAMPHSPAGNKIATSIQLGHRGTLPLNTSLVDLPGVRFTNSNPAQVASLYREITDTLKQDANKLEGRLAWLQKGGQQAEEITQRTRNALAEAQRTLQGMKPKAPPSKHNLLDWDKPISNGQRKVLANVVSLGNDEPITGKQVVWLAAATHGSYEKAVAHLDKAGIIGIASATDTLVWDKSAYALHDKLPRTHDTVRYHLAYHGSPHLFDKFSNDFLGTGEGAQSYGKGLYLADTIGTATHYQMMGLHRTSLLGSTIHPNLHSLSQAIIEQAHLLAPETAQESRSELENAVTHYVSARQVSRSYAQAVIDKQTAFASLLQKVDSGLMFYDTSFDRFRVLPATGSFGLRAIQEDADSTMRTGLFAIENSLDYKMGKAMSPEQRQQALQAHAGKVSDVHYHQERVESLEAKAELDPENDFVCSLLRDAKWDLYLAECAQAFLEVHSPLTVLPPTDKGHIYMVEVDIHDREYLLHDHPFSAQSELVKSALVQLSVDQTLDKAYRAQVKEAIAMDATGTDLYGSLFADPGTHVVDQINEENAVAGLVANGVKGIKYWDGQTRQRDEKNHNYVVFDAADLSIIGRQQDRVYGADYFDMPAPTAASMRL